MTQGAPLPGFSRPWIEPKTYLDAEGAVITYGDRWSFDGPPDDTYSVTLHPERFAPLHDIASAIVAFLVETYDVTASEDPANAGDPLYGVTDAVRAIRIEPADAECAPLTLVFTAYPGIIGHAGLSAGISAPHCGCDACDETWQSGADDLETWVDSIVNGRMTESVRTSHTVTYRDTDDAMQSELSASEASAPLLDRMRDLGVTPPWSRTWQPWPKRSGQPAAASVPAGGGGG